MFLTAIPIFDVVRLWSFLAYAKTFLVYLLPTHYIKFLNSFNKRGHKITELIDFRYGLNS